MLSRIINYPLRYLGLELRHRRMTNWATAAFDASIPLLEGIAVRNIFDIGANVGQSAAYYRDVYPKACVHCFEPSRRNLAILSERFEDFPNVKVVPVAVSNKLGSTALNLATLPTMNSIMSRPYHKSHSLDDAGTEIVETITIDSYVDSAKLTRVDFAKIDVEGAEGLVLQGAEKSLRNGAISILSIEVRFIKEFENQEHFVEICGFMEGFGYQIFDLPLIRRGGSQAAKGQISWADAVFISPEVQERIRRR